MAKTKEDNQATETTAAPPHIASEADMAAARRWFERARTVAETRNYDYAIECYIGGLGLWPEAIEEGHMPLSAVAVMRHQAGGKKPGLGETMKRKTGTKDFKQNMLNAEFLLSKDPGNITYMEQMFKNAGKARLPLTTHWIGQKFFEAAVQQKKLNPQHFTLMANIYEEVAEFRELNDDVAGAGESLQKAVDALEHLYRTNPSDLQISNVLRDLSSKLTIIKGKYSTASSFKESVADTEGQARLHDQDRLIQSEQRQAELIEAAKAEWQAAPDNPIKLMHYCDLMAGTEKREMQEQAVRRLTEAYQRSKNYRFKMRADDIRIRMTQHEARRLVAELQKNPDNAELKAEAQRLLADQLKEKLAIFAERVEQYPTDMRIRFEYAKLLFQAKEFDKAIPTFQQAQSEPRHRMECRLYIGRCFFERGYYSEAIDVLTQALEEYELLGDQLSKDMNYWLGRAYEASGQIDKALEVYGQVIQWEYNYGDVRARIDQLRAEKG